jgi:hypothetical protein
MPQETPEGEATRALQLIEGGAELAGASIGAAVGLIGGPPGALAGASAGVVATRAFRRLGSEIQQRWLGPRQRVRVGAAYAFAVADIAERLEAGDPLRPDGFFESDGTARSTADEVLEGVLLAAADANEEAKVSFLGHLLASLAFDESISRAHANHLIAVARVLSYRQLAIMAVIWQGDAAPLVQEAAELRRNLHFGDEDGLQVDELERRGILGRGAPGGTYKRGGATFVDASGVPVSELTLTGHGAQLYTLMRLSEIPPDVRKAVLDDLWNVGPAGTSPTVESA